MEFITLIDEKRGPCEEVPSTKYDCPESFDLPGRANMPHGIHCSNNRGNVLAIGQTDEDSGQECRYI